MTDFGARLRPYLVVTAISVVGLGLAAWRWWSRSGGLSHTAIRVLMVLWAIFFTALLLLFLLAPSPLPLPEAIGFAMFISVFMMGSGVAIWLQHKGRTR